MFVNNLDAGDHASRNSLHSQWFASIDWTDPMNKYSTVSAVFVHDCNGRKSKEGIGYETEALSISKTTSNKRNIFVGCPEMNFLVDYGDKNDRKDMNGICFPVCCDFLIRFAVNLKKCERDFVEWYDVYYIYVYHNKLVTLTDARI